MKIFKYLNIWQSNNIFTYLLLPFSLIYNLMARLRQLLITPIFLQIPTICVGNASIGGTGKSQMVIWLAKYFSKHKIKFCIITKGYKSGLNYSSLVNPLGSARMYGDEALMLASYAPTLIFKDIKGLLLIIRDLKPQIIIFDDGLQNPYFHKDLNILMIDALRKFGNEKILPAGPLRESLSFAAQKSDFAVILSSSLKKSSIHLDIPIYASLIKPKIHDLKNQKIIAFCAIGNPEKFKISLEELGAEIIEFHTYPDHYLYNDNDLSFLLQKSNDLGVILVTTEKDYVKILPPFKSFIKEIKVEITFNEEELADIEKKLNYLLENSQNI